MRVLIQRAIHLLAAALVCAAAGSNPVRAGEAEDLALTLAGRKALAQDKTLAAFNIGVRVENGAAELFGVVPTANAAARAEATLKSVSGIRFVTKELHVLPPDDPIAEKMARTLSNATSDSHGPNPVVFAPAGMPSPQVSPPSADAGRRLAAKPPPSALSLLDPVAGAAQVSEFDRRIDSLKAQSLRFRDLKAESQRGVIRVNGRVQDWNDLWEFADAISRMPGVERVVIGTVESK